jgi:hypothetical protein
MLLYFIGAVLVAIGALANSMLESKVGLPTLIAGVIVLVLKGSGALAADKPIPFAIGSTPIGKTSPAAPKPKRETDEQYLRRVSRPYPGKLE